MSMVRDTLRGKELLVTGVSGFLGKVWVGFVLDRIEELGRIHLLIRGKRQQTGYDRFLRMVERSPAFRPLRARHGANLHAFLESKIRVHEGDIADPNLGIDAGVLDEIAGRLDAVVHFAGLTDFQPDPIQGLETNSRGALNVADVTARLRVPRLVHCSTAYVAGDRTGRVPETLVPGVSPNGTTFDPMTELELAEAEAKQHEVRSERIDRIADRAKALGWPNIYTYSKGLAEHLLSQRTDLALTMLRPAIVECAHEFPFPGWNEGVNTSAPIVWLMSSWFRRLPASPDHHFDVIPVDTVAKAAALVTALAMRGEAEPVYQLASSSANPLLFQRAVDLNSLAYRRRYGRDESTWVERNVKRYFDGVFADPDRDPFPSMYMLREGVREISKLLEEVDVKRFVSARRYAKEGPDLERKRKTAIIDARNADRMMKRIEEMLRAYRPFIYDKDYVYETHRIEAATKRLSAEDARAFGFDIAELDWRKYWIDIHVPGLEQWSLPVLRGERAPEDPPFIHTKNESQAPTEPPRPFLEA
jgi:long-chain acyl-CoA synthetase